MGETWAPKARRKTHSDEQSRSQLAAAQALAFTRRWSGLVKRIFMRSATFWTSEVTVSARAKGTRSATFVTKTPACFSPRARKKTTTKKMARDSTRRRAERTHSGWY